MKLAKIRIIKNLLSAKRVDEFTGGDVQFNC